MDLLAFGRRFLLQTERGRGQHYETIYVGEAGVGFVQNLPRTMESNDEYDVVASSSMPMNNDRSGDSAPSSNSDHQDSSQSILSYQDRNMIVISLLIILIVLLFVTLIYLVYPPILAWYRRRRNGPQNEEEEKAHTLKRYETIEGWLISKRVVAHDKDCESIQRKFCRSCKYGTEKEPTSPRSVEPFSPKSVDMAAAVSFDSAESGNTAPSCSDGEDEDDEKECPICMEAFEVGDIVSWSPNTEVSCRHVFHHECIKEWMLQSGNCPCCRELILPIDAEGFQLERPVLKELCIKRARYAATSYYCQTDGLVCFDKRPGKCSKGLLDSLKTVTSCRIIPQDLVDRRGHRTGSAESDSKPVEPPVDCENPPSAPPADNSDNDSTTLPLMGEQQNTHNNDDATEQESTEYSGAPRLLDETDVDCEAPPLEASNSESEPILAEDIFSPSKLRNQINNATDRHRRAEVHETTV